MSIPQHRYARMHHPAASCFRHLHRWKKKYQVCPVCKILPFSLGQFLVCNQFFSYFFFLFTNLWFRGWETKGKTQTFSDLKIANRSKLEQKGKHKHFVWNASHLPGLERLNLYFFSSVYVEVFLFRTGYLFRPLVTYSNSWATMTLTSADRPPPPPMWRHSKSRIHEWSITVKRYPQKLLAHWIFPMI